MAFATLTTCQCVVLDLKEIVKVIKAVFLLATQYKQLDLTNDLFTLSIRSVLVF